MIEQAKQCTGCGRYLAVCICEGEDPTERREEIQRFFEVDYETAESLREFFDG